MKSSEKFKGDLPFAAAAETNKQNKSQNQVNELFYKLVME